MSGRAYPRDRVDAVLLKAGLPLSYRIMLGRYLASPLGTVPADSRFCSRADSHTILYMSPDFGTAFLDAGADPKIRDRDNKLPWDYVKDRLELRESTAYWRLNEARF